MKTMRGFSKLIGGLVGLVVCALAGAAQASLVWQIETTFGSGEITFPDATGDSSTGVEFSFVGFAEDDIAAINWTVDETTWELNRFRLQVLFCTPAEGTPTDSCFISDHVIDDEWTETILDLSLSAATFYINSVSCILGDPQCTLAISAPTTSNEDFDPTFTAVHEDIPEPTSFALFAIALGGLGFLTRRRAV